MPSSTTVPRLRGAERWQQRSASAAARPSLSRNSTIGSLQIRRASGVSPSSSPHAAIYQALRANMLQPPCGLVPAWYGGRAAPRSGLCGRGARRAAKIGEEHGEEADQRQVRADAVDCVDAGRVGEAAERRRADPGHAKAEPEEQA